MSSSHQYKSSTGSTRVPIQQRNECICIVGRLKTAKSRENISFVIFSGLFEITGIISCKLPVPVLNIPNFITPDKSKYYCKR